MRNIITVINLLAAIVLCVRVAQPLQLSDYPVESDESEFGEENILSEIFKVIIERSIKFFK